MPASGSAALTGRWTQSSTHCRGRPAASVTHPSTTCACDRSRTTTKVSPSDLGRRLTNTQRRNKAVVCSTVIGTAA